MDDKISTGKLKGVPETMLIPLYARAVETWRPDAIIQDQQAVEMMSRIDYDFTRFAEDRASILGIAIRTEILDEEVAAYIASHPDTVIIDLGAGLDARFSRVDNGRILWYDLDLPESIAVREQLIKHGDRQRIITKSVLNFSWFDDIERRDGTLVIAEGLLMYFAEDDVKALLMALAGHFPGADILLEVIGVSQSQRKERADMVSKTSAQFKWGIREAAAIAGWDARIIYLGDELIYDRYESRWLALDINWPVPPSSLRNTIDRIVHLRFSR